MHEATKLTQDVADTLAGLNETCGLAADGLMNLFIDAQLSAGPEIAAYRVLLRSLAQQVAGIRDLVSGVSEQAAFAAATTRNALG